MSAASADATAVSIAETVPLDASRVASLSVSVHDDILRQERTYARWLHRAEARDAPLRKKLGLPALAADRYATITPPPSVLLR